MLGFPVSHDDDLPPPAAPGPSLPDEAEPPPAPAPRTGRAPRRLLIQATLDDEQARALEAELRKLLGSRALPASPVPPSLVSLNAARDLPWTDLSFLALDTETTGLDALRDRVIEVAWVRVERGKETARFQSLCRIDEPMPAECAGITGISDEMLANERPFAEVAPALLDAMAGVDFVAAYNAPFDSAFLARELARATLSMPALPWVDPLVFIREVDRFKPGKKLADASRRWGVSLDRPHRALDDATATGELLLRVAPFLPARTLEDLLEQQHRLNARQQLEERAYQERAVTRAAPSAERRREPPPEEIVS